MYSSPAKLEFVKESLTVSINGQATIASIYIAAGAINAYAIKV